MSGIDIIVAGKTAQMQHLIYLIYNFVSKPPTIKQIFIEVRNTKCFISLEVLLNLFDF